MQQEQIIELGNELYEALVNRVPIQPFTERNLGITIDDAYHIQLQMIKRRIEAGEHVVGKKIGVTSKVVQKMLNVDQPDFGHLTSKMVYNQGEAVPIDQFLQPRAEGEIAFILKHDLIGPGVTNADVLRATECVMPCFEIVDSRIQDWKIKIQDTVADNASSGVFVLGDRAVDPRKVDLNLCGMVIEKNGELVGTGAGAAALGSPVNAVAWLANTLGRLGLPLKAGEVILSGSLAALIPVKLGDNLTMTLNGIGTASVKFI